jgi:hypothetical protein
MPSGGENAVRQQNSEARKRHLAAPPGVRHDAAFTHRRAEIMTRAVPPIALLISTFAFVLPAHAAGSLTRTFVSSTGVDTNPCTIAAPCASFAAAYAAVAAGGIIAALDPGKYGPVTITSTVTIDGNGWAAITAPNVNNGAGITINGLSNDKIILRGLIVDGAGGAPYGIVFNSGDTLTIDDIVIRNISAFGLAFLSSVGTTQTQTLSVSNSHFFSNANGVSIQAFGSGAIGASFARTEFIGNQSEGLTSLTGGGSVAIAVTDSVAANNGDRGFVINSGNVGTINLLLTRCQVANNAAGVEAVKVGATIWLAQSTLTGNASGYLRTIGGVVNSYGDNYITDTNNTGALVNVSKQ